MELNLAVLQTLMVFCCIAIVVGFAVLLAYAVRYLQQIRDDVRKLVEIRTQDARALHTQHT